MSNLKATNPRSLATTKQKVRATTGENELNLPCGVRRNRAASCPRSQTGLAEPKVGSSSQRRTRATSTAPKPITQRSDVKPGYKKPNFPAKQTTVKTTSSQQRAQPQHQLPSITHSHTGFTVIIPNPKKRLEIQKKAEAELTALEELRLSKATTYVSINPRAVGGCLSLEEVRQKQQHEMTQARKKPR